MCLITEGQVYSFLPPCFTLIHSHGHTCLPPFLLHLSSSILPLLCFHLFLLIFSHSSPFPAAQEARVNAKAAPQPSPPFATIYRVISPFHSSNFCLSLSLSSLHSEPGWLTSLASCEAAIKRAPARPPGVLLTLHTHTHRKREGNVCTPLRTRMHVHTLYHKTSRLGTSVCAPIMKPWPKLCIILVLIWLWLFSLKDSFIVQSTNST